MKAEGQHFDAAYYRRFYFDRTTRVADRAHIDRLGAFVCSYVRYVGIRVTRVLDVGCGVGLWQRVIATHFPRARYEGIEVSDYLCGRFGWQKGSVVDYRASRPFDLVICQGVLPYLNGADVKRAMLSLNELCRGALYVEAATREDWAQGVMDEAVSDARMFRHPARLYRRGLAQGFTELGGGVWLSKRVKAPLFALERFAP